MKFNDPLSLTLYIKKTMNNKTACEFAELTAGKIRKEDLRDADFDIA